MKTPAHAPTELPVGGFPAPHHVEPGDRVQHPITGHRRSPVLIVEEVRSIGGVTRVGGRFQDSGYWRSYDITDQEDLSKWGYLERGEEL